MSELLKFHLDEHISHRVADALRQKGIDVTTTTDAGLRKKKDKHHLDFAISQNRVMVTQDIDHLILAENLVNDGYIHYGIAYCKQQSLSISEMIRFLLFLYEVFEQAEMMSHVEYMKRL